MLNTLIIAKTGYLFNNHKLNHLLNLLFGFIKVYLAETNNAVVGVAGVEPAVTPTPRVHVNRYTTARRSDCTLNRRLPGNRLDALSARQDTLAGREAGLLQIRIFPHRGDRVIMTAEKLSLRADHRALFA